MPVKLETLNHGVCGQPHKLPRQLCKARLCKRLQPLLRTNPWRASPCHFHTRLILQSSSSIDPSTDPNDFTTPNQDPDAQKGDRNSGFFAWLRYVWTYWRMEYAKAVKVNLGEFYFPSFKDVIQMTVWVVLAMLFMSCLMVGMDTVFMMIYKARFGSG